MAMNQSRAGEMPNWSMSPQGNHPKGLLDTLTAVRWDLKHVLLEGAGCPAKMSTHIGRLFDELDASIDALQELIYEQGA